jgi:hypothetical protein
MRARAAAAVIVAIQTRSLSTASAAGQQLGLQCPLDQVERQIDLARELQLIEVVGGEGVALDKPD